MQIGMSNLKRVIVLNYGVLLATTEQFVEVFLETLLEI